MTESSSVGLSAVEIKTVGRNRFDKRSKIVCLELETTVDDFPRAGITPTKNSLMELVLASTKELVPDLSRVKDRPFGPITNVVLGD